MAPSKELEPSCFDLHSCSQFISNLNGALTTCLMLFLHWIINPEQNLQSLWPNVRSLNKHVLKFYSVK